MSKTVIIKRRQIIHMGVRNQYYQMIVDENLSDEEIIEQFEEVMNDKIPMSSDFDIEETEDMEIKIDK